MMKKEPVNNYLQLEELLGEVTKLMRKRKHVFVAVSGFGGSGKTSLAGKIKSHFSDSTWVQLDNFLIDHGEGEGWAGGYDWGRFEQVLKDMKAGKDLHYKFYDWHKNALSDDYIDEVLPKLVVVEGVRILQPKLMNYYDLSVWIDVDLDQATERGKRRDENNWEDKFDHEGIQAHLSTWHTTWAPKDKEFYDKFHPDKLADFIYDNQISVK